MKMMFDKSTCHCTDSGPRVWHIQSCEDGRHAIRNVLYLKCCYQDTDDGPKGGVASHSSACITPFPHHILTATAPVLGAGASAELGMESRTRDIMSTVEAAV